MRENVFCYKSKVEEKRRKQALNKQKYHIFRNMKLRSKLLCSYLLTCLVPLLITTTIIYHFAVKNLEEESMELAVLYSSQIVSNIDNTIAGI